MSGGVRAGRRSLAHACAPMGHALSLLTVRGARLHTQEFNKTGSTLIFHLTNHYALIYGSLML